MPKYENSVIYKLKHNEDYDDTNIYVGSTTNFKNRKYQHKNYCNESNFPVYQYIRNNGGWDEWVMIPIEPYPCISKNELEIRERYHIDLLKSKLNKYIPTRTIKEWIIDNKEHSKEWQVRYYKNNKEQILEKNKIYYENNKEQILEQSKQYRKNNKKKIKEDNKKIYKKNKEKILEKKKIYYEDNKEIISKKIKEKVICDHCGCEITKVYLKKHQKSKKCLKSQEDNI